MRTGAFRGFEVTLQDPGIAVISFNRPERLNGTTAHVKRDLVETLLRRFPADPAFWHPLNRDFRVQLRLGVHTARCHRAFSLSAASLTRCSATGAPLLFDLYIYEAADS